MTLPADEHNVRTRITLALSAPAVAKEWHPSRNGELTPEDVLPFSNKVVWWQCEHDERHEWQAKVAQRSKGTGCPYCSGRLAVPGENDLKTLYPQLAAQWHPVKNGALMPENVLPGSNKKVWWRCEQRHEWEATVYNRSKAAGTSCPFCSGQRAVTGVNDLATLRPDIAALWHPTKNGSLQPSLVTLKSHKKVWWQCPVDREHVYQASVQNLTRYTNSSGCPFCAKRVVTPGKDDLATLAPGVGAQWHPSRSGDLLPEHVSPGADVKVWWQCEDGHEWETWVHARKNRGCRKCSSGKSRAEADLREVVQQMLGSEVVVLHSERSILGNGQELDIYVPEHKFAVEFNGLYWHSDAFKERTYHRDKYEVCASKGITLYQVWEDDWAHRRDVVLRGIAHRLHAMDGLRKVRPDLPGYLTESVNARACALGTIPAERAEEFLEENHIQGSVLGSHYLALIDDASRVRALLVVAKKAGSVGEYYIHRYATAGNVRGGFSRLLAYAERILEPQVQRWITFADLEVSQGALYENNGFIVDAVLPPDYSYVVRDSAHPQGHRVHKFNFRLKRFREDPNLVWQEGATERQLATLNGIARIYDSGKIRYVRDVQR